MCALQRLRWPSLQAAEDEEEQGEVVLLLGLPVLLAHCASVIGLMLRYDVWCGVCGGDGVREV
jgi:hypothetical protein